MDKEELLRFLRFMRDHKYITDNATDLELERVADHYLLHIRKKTSREMRETVEKHREILSNEDRETE